MTSLTASVRRSSLRLIAQVEKIDIAQTIAVGDGANDLPMLSTAGLGIAFHAKPKVKAEASQSLSSIGIDGVLSISLGFKDSLHPAASTSDRRLISLYTYLPLPHNRLTMSSLLLFSPDCGGQLGGFSHGHSPIRRRLLSWPRHSVRSS